MTELKVGDQLVVHNWYTTTTVTCVVLTQPWFANGLWRVSVDCSGTTMVAVRCYDGTWETE